MAKSSPAKQGSPRPPAGEQIRHSLFDPWPGSHEIFSLLPGDQVCVAAAGCCVEPSDHLASRVQVGFLSTPARCLNRLARHSGLADGAEETTLGSEDEISTGAERARSEK
ncbi:MAG: hypothetical protein Q8R88_16345 [Desulfoprunum sp.]|nr:hypothetical protein [Desulfoprunum sp.]